MHFDSTEDLRDEAIANERINAMPFIGAQMTQLTCNTQMKAKRRPLSQLDLLATALCIQESCQHNASHSANAEGDDDTISCESPTRRNSKTRKAKLH